MDLEEDESENLSASKISNNNLEELKNIYMEITGELLPELAKNKNWVIRFDHCFQRVILDNIFDDVWYNHLDKESQEPAYRQLERKELIDAIKLANQMVDEGHSKVKELNETSLRHRNKM